MNRFFLFITPLVALLFITGNINAQIINHGPNQRITSADDFETLLGKLDLFYFGTHSLNCKNVNALFPELKSKGKPPFDYDYVKDGKISYKLKKQKLLKEYKHVIAYIEKIYSTPIEKLEKKHTEKRYDHWDMRDRIL